MKKFAKPYYVNVIFIDCGYGDRFFCVEDSKTNMFVRIQSLRKRFPENKFSYSRELVIPDNVSVF